MYQTALGSLIYTKHQVNGPFCCMQYIFVIAAVFVGAGKASCMDHRVRLENLVASHFLSAIGQSGEPEPAAARMHIMPCEKYISRR